MSFGNTTENDILELLLKATALSWTADANLKVHLHTADPGEAGTTATNEATYTSYATVTVSRSGSGWTVSGNVGSNAALIQFPTCTGGTNTITHVSIGNNGTQIIASGALTSSLSVSNGIQPQFAIGALTLTVD